MDISTAMPETIYSSWLVLNLFVNWAIAAKPQHPVFYKAAKMIVQKVMLLSLNSTGDKDVLAITGPELWTAAVLQHFVDIGYLANSGEVTIKNASFWQNNHINTLVGDVAILNKQAFGFHRLHKNSPHDSSKELYIRHWFMGRWREK